jgi:hypothetical protein
MMDKTDFGERLLAAQEVTPALREEYQRQLDVLLHERPTLRTRALAISLVVICSAVVAGEIRAMVVHRGDVAFYAAAVTMLLTCAAVAIWVLRDLVRGKAPRKHAFQVSEMLYGASWVLVVVQLLKGLGAPGDPASTFGVLFVMAFAAVCTTWGLANRISATELAAKEQALRLGCRLIDLAEKLDRRERQG